MNLDASGLPDGSSVVVATRRTIGSEYQSDLAMRADDRSRDSDSF